MAPTTYADALDSALTDVRAADPTRPVTVLCGPHARGDVIVALAATGPQVGVTVQTLDMYLKQRARELAPRTPLPHRRVAVGVAHLLHNEPSAFADRRISDQPLTRRALSSAVLRLLSLPPQWRENHGGVPLPEATFEVARRVEAAVRDDYFTVAEQYAQAMAPTGDDRAFLLVGVVAGSPAQDLLLDNLPGETRRVDPRAAHGHTTTSYVDEEDEVHSIARTILAEDTPLHEIAVAYCRPDYLEKITRIFTAAGLPFTAAGTRTWEDEPAVRAFSWLVRVDPARMPRRALADVLATGQLGDGAPSLWEFDRVTRGGEGVITEGADWELAAEDDRTADVLRWTDSLRQALVPVHDASTWAQTGAALRSLVDRFLIRAQGPAQAVIDSAVADLADLDGLMPPPTRTLVRELLDDAFARTRPSETSGQIVVGGLETLTGRNLRTAFICGANDTVLPGTWTMDPSITAAQSGADAADFQRRRRLLLDAAVASADTVHFSYPHSHLAGDGSGQPSPWVPETDRCSRGLRETFAVAAATPVTDAENRVLRALHGQPSESAAGYRDRMRWRREAAFGEEAGAEYNGRVGAGLSAHFFERDLSASALADYTRSPLLFFLQRVVGARALEDPEPGTDFDPRERGTLYHRIFEEWTRRVWLESSPHPTSYADVDWVDARRQLSAITEQALAGIPSARYGAAAWASFRADVEQTLARWFERERREASEGWVPVAVEQVFGGSRDVEGRREAVRIVVDDGSEVRLQGSIDRIDVRESTAGREIRVTDYKSGKAADYRKKITPEHPTGTTGLGHEFQLALYGSAIRAGLNEDAAVTARYWCFRDRDGDCMAPLEVTERVDQQFRAQVAAFHRHVTAGFFPAHEMETEGFHGPDRDVLRFGRTNYARQAERMARAGHTPISVLPQKESDQ